MLGVPPVDPRRPSGELHLFHLVRDDLELLHGLMEDWRIVSLAQLEGLLASESAAAAVPDGAQQELLRERCEVARTWMDFWRQGRGRPVDRIALEASGVISATFLDRVAELAEEMGGDAAALLRALRSKRVPRFREGSVDELEGWLREEGYWDPAERLDRAGRERCTLQTLAHRIAPEVVRGLVAWLEAATQEERGPLQAGNRAVGAHGP
jgi:hypothetical protein